MSATGERILPPSRRPDGTLRKEVRIRAGYVPQDEQAVYEARGTVPRGSGGPHLPPGLDPAHVAAKQAKSNKYAKKNERKREKKAAEAASGAHGPEGDEEGPETNGPSAAVQNSLADLHVSAPKKPVAAAQSTNAAPPPSKPASSKSASPKPPSTETSKAASSKSKTSTNPGGTAGGVAPSQGGIGGEGGREASGGSQEEANSKVDVEKKIRALRKKIRQAEMLAEGLKAGSEPKPTPEVLEKIGKLPGWHEEVRQLEAQQ
eukprot:TRINITY_DN26642_c0_g1_i1.p1 TRINITY_DN26642_c0_g1~~TRINITY_DN26642_c0_g1_i1.p1  ORF type:complete len:261 (+),score=61.97 TRINITY_DN26642_c0_g1_i1:564-1346(+)